MYIFIYPLISPLNYTISTDSKTNQSPSTELSFSLYHLLQPAFKFHHHHLSFQQFILPTNLNTQDFIIYHMQLMSAFHECYILVRMSTYEVLPIKSLPSYQILNIYPFLQLKLLLGEKWIIFNIQKNSCCVKANHFRYSIKYI